MGKTREIKILYSRFIPLISSQYTKSKQDVHLVVVIYYSFQDVQVMIQGHSMELFAICNKHGNT